MTTRSLDITPSPRLLEVLGDIPMEPWACIAELIDNSLDELASAENDRLEVRVELEQGSDGAWYLVVADNAAGMTEEALALSLRAGYSSKSRYGTLGLFGMGFNIATARLGTLTTVQTTTRGSRTMLEVTIDFQAMQAQDTFLVPVSEVPCDSAAAGTTVRVRLKPAIADELRREAFMAILRQKLGSVYTFMLRTGVPGLSHAGHGSRINATLSVGGVEVQPQLPCVWSDSRSVTSAGSQVHAVQYIDRTLTEATACLHCGYWDRKNGPEECEECGSTALEKRERRIWGWIGIQRYIDASHFGIDFFRYGRKILTMDKSLFTYEDPDTLRTEVEYPIEMPANRGRIIGEIHLDHVRVTYQKNDFDRQTRDWQVAIAEIRGDSPLKPKTKGVTNTSPLARLYSAYRRNDAGLRYLTPGDGKSAIHEKAREWASFFDKGVERYRDDSEWYEAAQRHEAVKNAPAGTDTEGVSQVTQPGSGAIENILGPPPAGDAQDPPTAAPPATTIADDLARLRIVSHRREDLSGRFVLGGDLGEWDLVVYTTQESLMDSNGVSTPARPGRTKGSELEIFVSTTHEVFSSYGRDVRDVALIGAAEVVRILSGSAVSVADVYAQLVLLVADLRVTPNAVAERCDRTIERTRELLAPVVEMAPTQYWDALSTESKASVEMASLARFAAESFESIVADGRFATLLTPAGIQEVIRSNPDAFFGGIAFVAGVAGRNPEARERLVGGVLRDFEAISDFKQDLLLQAYDLRLVLLHLDHLEDALVSEDADR